MPVDVTLPSDREIRVVRSFNAPRQLVWDCHTKPDLMKRWLFGPVGWSMPICVVDLRVGGKYRYVWRNTDGRQFGSHGKHLEVVTHQKLVTTEEMDGFDGPLDIENPVEGPNPAINTLTLVESGGRTTLTMIACYPTKEVRDMALQSGMTDGMEAGYERLDAIAAEALA